MFQFCPKNNQFLVVLVLLFSFTGGSLIILTLIYVFMTFMVNKTRLERCNPCQNTHVFFANSELLIKDYVSYFSETTSVSNNTNHVVLTFSLSYVNQYQYVTWRVNSVVAY
jgi:hypothetical protein